jgi:hypothetical protein
MVVAQQRFTQVRGAGADKSLYQQKASNPVYGQGLSMLLFRVWHPTLKVHDLGQMGIESVCYRGISIGFPIGYCGEARTTQLTSNVKTIEKLSDGLKSSVYKVVTETGSIYQVVFLK